MRTSKYFRRSKAFKRAAELNEKQGVIAALAHVEYSVRKATAFAPGKSL